MRIFEMSLRRGMGHDLIERFPLLHHLHKIPEQVVRVVRAGRGLRVILHAEQRQRAVPQSFQRIVVQIDVR